MATKTKKADIVAYVGNHEILLCIVSKEKDMLKRWFTEGSRDPDEYDRFIAEGVVQIETAPSYFHGDKTESRDNGKLTFSD